MCRHDSERGFSYVDVLIAMTILMVGILTLGAALTSSLIRANQSEDYLRAKDLAASTLENVLSARSISVGTQPHSFDNIQNVGSADGLGLFVTGNQTVLSDPGPDGLFGTTDDTGQPVGSYKREIVIEDVANPNRPTPPNPITERRVRVTIYYTVQGREDQVTIRTNVCDY
jgi:type II secretory pathway pseudopilin PulG